MRKKILRKILWVLAAIVVAGISGITIFYLLVQSGAFGPLPDKDDLAQIRHATATIVFSADKEVIGRIFSENRTNVTYAELPENLVQALVATEDARFFEHEGIDTRSMMRVLVKSILLQDESAGGGSTLSQQLAKNLFGRKNFGFLTLPVNKFKEMILARRLESLYTKEQIIELYFNTVTFSENIYGIGMASRRFFNKKPADLEPHESAVLVGILKANTYYNPRLNPDHSLRRRNLILHQMQRYGYLEPAATDSLQELPLELSYYNLEEEAHAAYFLVRVKEEATEILEHLSSENGEPYDLEVDGLRIYTTLNSRMQTYAEEAVREHMAYLQDRFNRHWGNRQPWGSRPEVFTSQLQKSKSYINLKKRNLSQDSLKYYLEKPKPVLLYHPKGDTVMEMSVKDSVAYYIKLLNSAFLAMDPNDGAILAWVGGLHQQYLPYDHVLAMRQAASTFKPFVYATALRAGIDPCTYIPNERRMYPEFENWAPRNYDDEYGGYYSMPGALKKSINVAAVQTIFEAGIENVLSTAHSFGINSRLPNDPSLALGTGSVSLLEMVRAYSVFANGGHRVQPYFITRIEDARGKVLYETEISDQGPRVLEEDIAHLMNAMLQGVVNEGTGSRLRSAYGIQSDLAGKTGTAQNYADGWFIGYNPQLVAGVWVGASSPVVHFRSGTYGSGSAMALPVFGNFYRQMLRNPELNHYSRAGFKPLPKRLERKIACDDFKEKNLMDTFFGIFNEREGQVIEGNEQEQGEDEAQPDQEQKKKGFFEKIFGGKKKDQGR